MTLGFHVKSALVVTLTLVVLHTQACPPVILIQIKQQLTSFLGQSSERHMIGREMWQDFFRDYPEAKKYFQHVNVNNTHSVQFKAHSARVMGGINLMMNLLDDPPLLHAQNHHLRRMHTRLNVPDEYIKAFVRSLWRSLIERVGSCYKKDDWRQCSRTMAHGLLTGIKLKDVQHLL